MADDPGAEEEESVPGVQGEKYANDYGGGSDFAVGCAFTGQTDRPGLCTAPVDGGAEPTEPVDLSVQ